MTAKVLTDAMKRVQMWPEATQEELAAIALEIDAALKDGVYHATPEELLGIDRGLASADAERIAAPDDVAAVFAKHRPGMRVVSTDAALQDLDEILSFIAARFPAAYSGFEMRMRVKSACPSTSRAYSGHGREMPQSSAFTIS